MPSTRRVQRRLDRTQRRLSRTPESNPRRASVASTVNSTRRSRGQAPVEFDTRGTRRRRLERKEQRLKSKLKRSYK